MFPLLRLYYQTWQKKKNIYSLQSLANSNNCVSYKFHYFHCGYLESDYPNY